MTLVIIFCSLLPLIAVLVGILRANSIGSRMRRRFIDLFIIEKSDQQPIMDAAIEEVEHQFQSAINEMDLLEEQSKDIILKAQEELNGTPPETRFERILRDEYPL